MDDLQTVEFDQPGDAPPTPPSTVVRVFRNRFDQWRAGWRIVVFLILLVPANIALSAVMRSLLPGARSDLSSWAYSAPLLAFNVMFIAVAFAVLRWFDRRPVSLLGMGLGRGWLRELTVGLAVGIVSTGGLTLVLVLFGLVSLELNPRVADAWAAMPKYLIMFTMAGAAEELIFRGYMLQALAEGSRRWFAAVLLSLVFAVVHLGNPDTTVVGIANIFLVGMVIAILYFQTLRLWLPIGYHLSWNWAHGWLWGFDVSGIELENTLLKATPNGHDLLTGGEFGLEGSILTTALIMGAGVWLLTRKVLTPTPEVAAIWAPYPRGFGLPPVEAPSSPDTDGILTATAEEGGDVDGDATS